MRIHQTLHGYNQGHNLLYSSINLPVEDEDYMKRKSDWTEYVPVVGDDASYITTYRLPQSHYYVIAKSWYAPEMSRPGCVWTHSFILNFAEISRDFDFRGLLYLFRRPEKLLTGYGIPLDVDKHEALNQVSTLEEFSLKEIVYLYTNLLQRNHEFFLVENQSMTYQNLILSILQYLPIEVIADLNMCSGTSANPTGSNNEMNLAFSGSFGRNLHDIIEMEEISLDSFDIGYVYFANAIKKQNTKVDKILRTFSSDIGSDAHKLSTFGYLLYSLENPEESNYQQILRRISNSFPSKSDGLKIKDAFLSNRVVELFTTIDAFYLELCVNDYQNAIDFCEKYPYSIVVQNLSENFDKFQLFFNKVVNLESISTYGQQLLQYIANNINVEWQQKLFEGNWSLYLSLLNLNPSWLYNSYWLDASKTRLTILLSVFEKIDLSLFREWASLMNTILRLDVQLSYTIRNALSTYYPDCVKDCMLFIQDGNNCNELCVFLCRKHISAVIQWMKEQYNYSKECIFFITSIVSPTSQVVKSVGSQPWFRMLSTIKELDEEKLYVFLYQLSFNWTDSNALAMLKESFWKLYNLCANNRFCNANINTLSPYLAVLPPWQWWDNCKKMRKGLVKAMKQVGYHRSDIKNFTPSEDLNKTLLKIWDK